ncbi:MAG: calcium-binding protein [Solirubrobacterales bacterium]
MLLLLAGISGAAQAAPAAASGPTCASGPQRIGDKVVGTPCADVIVAPPGVASVECGGGNDTILAAPMSAGASCPAPGCRLGVGGQTFEGGPGDDVVFGERGNDILRGNEGNDRLYGGIGDDLLEGGPGNDLLSGGFGADGIDGGPGNDYVRGDGTQDEIVDTGPSSDADTLSYATGVTPGFTRDLPLSPIHPGFPGEAGERGVYLDLSTNLGDNGVAPNGGGVDNVEGSDFERIIGSPFSDYIAGSKETQAIFGGGGADVLIAGDSGTNLSGGADGDDCVNGESDTTCESVAQEGPVVLRDTGQVSVGSMAFGEGEYTGLYLVGSTAADEVVVTSAGSPPTEKVTFELAAPSSFAPIEPAETVCKVKIPTEAICTPTTPLDSVLVAAMGANDKVVASALPATTSLMLLGGEGNDELSGGEESDDTLVDGPGNDTLLGHSGDDALLNNKGSDQLLGEGGNDLFLSNSICNGDLVSGGEGRDNASWAKFKEGVDARLDLRLAGEPTPGGMPQCGAGSLDTLEQVEDLEGSSSGDVLYGDSGPNQLLGHAGPDTYYSGAGEDSILANSADFDPVIDCGDDIDTAIIDHPQYGDVAAPNCENVFEADPNNFRNLTRLPPAVAPQVPPRDTTPPRTRITSHPPKVIWTHRAKRRVVFRFASSEPDSRFRCRLDGKPYRFCASPRAFVVATGRHTIRISAIDPSGNVDRSPASFAFRVRRR